MSIETAATTSLQLAERWQGAARSLLVISALTLSGCGGESTSVSEEMVFEGGLTVDMTECMERFADKGVFGDKDVRASFTYDISALGQNAVNDFWGGNPSVDGAHRGVIVEGDDVDAGLSDFLDADPQDDTEMFEGGDVTLLRVNEAEAPFSDALRAGCGRLREGVTIRQVQFSRGKN